MKFGNFYVITACAFISMNAANANICTWLLRDQAIQKTANDILVKNGSEIVSFRNHFSSKNYTILRNNKSLRRHWKMLELFNSDPFVWDELGKPNGTRILGVHPVLGDIGVRVRTDGSINLSFNANAINQEQVERMDLIQNEFKKAFVLTQERLGPKSTLTIIKQRTGTGINVEEKLGNSNSPDSNFELMQLLILNLSNAHR